MHELSAHLVELGDEYDYSDSEFKSLFVRRHRRKSLNSSQVSLWRQRFGVDFDPNRDDVLPDGDDHALVDDTLREIDRKSRAASAAAGLAHTPAAKKRKQTASSNDKRSSGSKRRSGQHRPPTDDIDLSASSDDDI